MSDKSYVSMEQKMCMICGLVFSTDSILLDTRLKESMDRETITGFGLCEEHQKLYDEGYIALIEIDPEKSGLSESSSKANSSEVYRTGRYVHIRKEVFEQLFGSASTGEDGKTLEMMWVEPSLMTELHRLSQSSGEKQGE